MGNHNLRQSKQQHYLKILLLLIISKFNTYAVFPAPFYPSNNILFN
jgi:hypothetical protein